MGITLGENKTYMYNNVIPPCIKKSVLNMGIKLYNKLPIEIKQLDTYKSFKKEVKTFLAHKAVYTIEEFYAL